MSNCNQTLITYFTDVVREKDLQIAQLQHDVHQQFSAAVTLGVLFAILAIIVIVYFVLIRRNKQLYSWCHRCEIDQEKDIIFEYKEDFICIGLLRHLCLDRLVFGFTDFAICFAFNVSLQ